MTLSIAEQIALAQHAAQGESQARNAVNSLIHPIINYQTARFCKRYCYENCYRYACTLEKPIGPRSKKAHLCEWGNASYGWMLNDLSNSNRLLRYQGKFDSSLKNYIYSIANSLPFYQRWKQWRFDGSVHVPTYIKVIHPDASNVFYALRAQHDSAFIAQDLGRSIEQIQDLCRAIIVILTKKHRLYLLDPPVTQSLSTTKIDSGSEEVSVDADIPVYDETIELTQDKLFLTEAWMQLNPVEQYVLEAMIIEEQDADDILLALKKVNISIKSGVDARHTNRQQLYYFRRKTLVKLSKLIKN